MGRLRARMDAIDRGVTSGRLVVLYADEGETVAEVRARHLLTNPQDARAPIIVMTPEDRGF